MSTAYKLLAIGGIVQESFARVLLSLHGDASAVHEDDFPHTCLLLKDG
jgi:hypothetical protein